MSSKKKKPATAKPAAKPAARPRMVYVPGPDDLTKKNKADLTRFARDIAEEYDGRPNASVYKIKRALNDAPALRSTILELGSRAWMQESFRADVEDLIDKLPSTAFRVPLTPEEREAKQKAKQKALVDDMRKYSLSTASVRALRVAFSAGYRKEAKREAQATFDKLYARTRSAGEAPNVSVPAPAPTN